ncbi:MAG: mechanosensitive ion channel family protein [Bacteroidetes bacterium]|nr:mechanosensitive ion channel family protein [Bacteroidota bacterium]
MDIQKYTEQGMEMAVTYAPKIVLAIVVLVVGLFIIGRFTKFFRRTLEKGDVETTLAIFLTPLISILLKAMLIISVASMVGIATTSFIAVLGAMGLAVGLALQGSLANFAGGVLILLFKPFKVGDIVTAQGHTGKVEEISILVTNLLTPQNRLVIIPNGPLANGNIVNLTAKDFIRVDLTIGIAYGEDIKAARDVLMKVMNEDPKVLKDPAPSVNVKELADSSVNLLLLPFAKTEDYWDVTFDIQEQGKIALDKAGIEIPFPQRVIHKAE